MHFGSNRLDESIISYIRREFNLVIGKKTAMALKEQLGSGLPGRTETMVVVGLDVVSGLPVEREISAEVVYASIKTNLESVCTSIKLILEKTPPELARDIIHAGIYITGGGSKIQNLDQLFTQITNIKVNTCEEPEQSAVRGLSKIATDSKYKRLPFSIKNRN
jgi:rod shape-determining protein MreB